MATKGKTIRLPKEVWDKVSQAALDAGAREGRRVTNNDWMSRAVEEKLARDKGKKQGGR